MFGNFSYRIIIFDNINQKIKHYPQMKKKVHLIYSIEEEFTKDLEKNKVYLVKNKELVNDIKMIFGKDIFFGSTAIERLMLFIQNLINRNINSTGLFSNKMNDMFGAKMYSDEDDGGLGSKDLDFKLSEIALMTGNIPRSKDGRETFRDPKKRHQFYDEQNNKKETVEVKKILSYGDEGEEKSITNLVISDKPTEPKTPIIKLKQPIVFNRSSNNFDLNVKQNNMHGRDDRSELVSDPFAQINARENVIGHY
jgi:hypothetical protein